MGGADPASRGSGLGSEDSDDDEDDTTYDDSNTTDEESASVSAQRYKGGQRYTKILSSEEDDVSNTTPHKSSRISVGLGDENENDNDIDNLDLGFGEYDNTPDNDQATLDARRRLQTRRVYGGGAHFHSVALAAPGLPGGSRGVVSTAWMLFAYSVGPGTPLLIAYAYSLTGLYFGIPLTAGLLLVGAAFAPTVLTVEARYVGARTYASLAGAVVPQVYGIRYAGETLLHLFSVFVAGGRGLIALYIARDLLAQLASHLFPRADILQSRLFLGLVLGLTHALPAALLLPTVSCVSVKRTSSSSRRRFSLVAGNKSSRSNSFLAAIPLSAPLLYPVILLILGVSLKNLENYPSILKPHPKTRPPFSTEPLHTPTLWSGVSVLLLLTAGIQQHVFALYRQLRRAPAHPGATASQTNLSSSKTSTVSKSAPANAGLTASAPPNAMQKYLNRHRWESSLLLSAFLTALVLIPFGSVGYASLLKISPDLFGTLPLDHAWFNFARVLAVVCVLLGVRNAMKPAETAARAIVSMPRKLWYPHIVRQRDGSGNASRHKRRRSGSSVMDLDGGGIEEDALEGESAIYTHHDDEEMGNEGQLRSMSQYVGSAARTRAWEGRIANSLVYGGVTALLCTVRDLGSLAEIIGGIGASWYSFILPGEIISCLDGWSAAC